MNRFWKQIIEPSIELLGSKNIVEIGIDEGKNTRKILEYCKRNNGKLYGIDPAPRIDVIHEFKEYKEQLVYLPELSLNAIEKIPSFDIILIDGDHNWFTVYNELKLVRKTNEKFPVVFFHDISFPYARRDLYYNPDNIPKGYLNAYAKKGINIDGGELIEIGGMNASFNNCIYENSINNGVLTAIEDFIREQPEPLQFIKLCIFNGLGVVYDEKLVSKEFIQFIDKFKISDELNEFLIKSDKTMAKEHVKLLEEQHANRVLKRNIEDLTELQKQKEEQIKNQSQQYKQESQHLEDLNEKKEEQIGYLQERQRELIQNIKIIEQKHACLETEYLNKEKMYVVKINKQEQSKLNIAIKLNTLYGKKNVIGMKYALKNLTRIPIKAILANIKGIKAIRNKLDFDYSYYIEENIDISSGKIDPLVHYIWFGGYEGRNPSLDFDTNYYTKRYNDVKESKINPLVHYYLYGKAEQRACKPTVTKIINSTPSNTSITINNSEFSISSLDHSDGNKVSIVMPTWNRAKVIRRAIDSVLKQSYPNFEIIISDDGSTDGTDNLIENYYSKELQSGKIKYIRNKGNNGVCRARNVALKNTIGEYIAYLDSDNEWRPDFLKEMMNVFINHPEYGCIYCDELVNDNIRNIKLTRSVDYDRKKLLEQNFIDLNVFMHKRVISVQNGSFDENLKRLVDWDLIARYTKYNKPYHLKKTLVDYYLDDKLGNISFTVSLDDNYNKISKKHRRERAKYGIDTLKVAYILWDYPAASQTFVFNEMKYAIEQGYDVTVFYKELAVKSRQPDFEVTAYKVNDYKHLAKMLVEHDIDIMHTHFVYPAGTLLTYEASKITGIPFTIAAHAVDIFHYSNDKRNKIKEIANHKNCEKILVSGGYNLEYLIERGVPGNKIVVSNQAIDERFVEYKLQDKKLDREVVNIAAIGRFIEKKGFEYLIECGQYLNENININIYGYGDLEDKYKKLIEQFGLHEQVKLQGEIATAEELMEVYKKSDILLVPSVRAENGDMDGVPTVVLEAMAMGVPVIGTSVSSIPYTIKDGYNGFIVKPRDIKSLADKINSLVEQDKSETQRIIDNAKKTVQDLSNQMTMQHALVNLWKQEEVDIFLVVYNDGQEIEETKQIVENLYEKTTSRFTLTIVDNNSCKEMKDYLKSITETKSNIRFINLSKNIMCGPASNLALSMLENEYAIYVCSNEGYVLKYGWERELVGYMRENNNCAIAGHLSYSPKFYNKKTYEQNDFFKDFRNNEKLDVLTEDIYHVQGGIYILKMDAYSEQGGFSDKFPQNLMDVEYSYYLQSCGYDLGNISTVLCGTKKTLPNPSDFVDDQTLIIHPFTKKQYKEYVSEMEKDKCTICNIYTTFDDNKCPKCQSTSKDRALFRYLYDSNLIYRNVKLNHRNYFTECNETIKTLDEMFNANVKEKDISEIILYNVNPTQMLNIKDGIKKLIYVGNRSEIINFEERLKEKNILVEKEIKEYYSKQVGITDIQVAIYDLKFNQR